MKIIRLWRFDNTPTATMMQKLRDLIAVEDMRKDGVMDIIWGPDLDLNIVIQPDDTDVLDSIEIMGDHS